jgi:hypothetical protein
MPVSNGPDRKSAVLFDHLVGAQRKRGRYVDAQSFGDFYVYRKTNPIFLVISRRFRNVMIETSEGQPTHR